MFPRRSLRLRFKPALIASAAGSFLILGGCSTTAPEVSRPAPPAATTGAVTPPAASEFDPARLSALRLGQKQEDIRRWLGEPMSVRAADGASAGLADTAVELWLYQATLPPGYKEVVAEMEEIPFYDPITGESKPQQQARPSLQRVDRTAMVVLAFAEGKLVDIRQQVQASQSITR